MTTRRLNELPEEAGEYNIVVTGWRTMLPLFLKFDGEKWDVDSLLRFRDPTTDALPAVYWYEGTRR
jgi:hypothetical protein